MIVYTPEFTAERIAFESAFPDSNTYWREFIPQFDGIPGGYWPHPGTGATISQCYGRDRHLKIWLTAKGIPCEWL